MSKQQVTVPVFVPHLGCPHRCAFCNQWAVSGAASVPDGTLVRNRIEQYLESIPDSVKRVEVAFFGGSFTGIPSEIQKELLGPASGFLVNGKVHAIRVSTRPDYIDHAKLDLLSEFGVTLVELGVQSLDDRVLEASKRGHTAGDVYRAVELIKKRGMKFGIQLMPGLPGDTAEISVLSAQMGSELGPACVRLYPAVVLENTLLCVMYKKGEYRPLSLEEAVETCASMHGIFSRCSIPVIRTGLHPFSPGELKHIVAGPYHPAFGFFVKSRIKRNIMEDKIREFLRSNPCEGEISLSLPPVETEEYLGHKKENIRYLAKTFNLDRVRYAQAQVSKITIDSQ